MFRFYSVVFWTGRNIYSKRMRSYDNPGYVSYPTACKKLILSELLFIILPVMMLVVLGYICFGIFMILADQYLEFIRGEFEILIFSYVFTIFIGVYYVLVHKADCVERINERRS